MTRKTLIMLAGGAIAVAVIGSAIGASAADVAPARDTTPPATVSTPSDDSSGRPGDDSAGRPGDDSAGRPTDDGTARPSDDSTAPASTAAASAGRDRAIQIALGRTGGGTVVKVESEQEHGRSVWSVRIVKNGVQLRVDVDAATGKVVRSEQTTATGSHGRDDRSGDDKGTDDKGTDDKGTDDRQPDDRGGRR
jgi:hypothetical protein